jgi:hypothetical protein
MHVDLGDFQFVDPDDGSVDISGTGITLDAEWKGLSIAGNVPASSVALDLPTAEIHDVSTFSALIPETANLALDSGTGQVTARLEITEQVATGTLDLVAKEIALETHDTPLVGDLEVHANLAKGDLSNRRFDPSGTTVLLDKIVNRNLSDKKQEKLDPWYLKVGIQQGNIIFGKPSTVDGKVTIEMYDTRPIMRLLKNLDAGPGWLSLAPTIKNVDGSVNVSLGAGHFAIGDLALKGDGFEALGWMDARNKITNGRLFVRFKSVMAGVSFDDGKSKVHLSKPRKWFDEQPTGPAAEAPPPATAPENAVPSGEAE